ncbi:hypothetical protein SEA_SPARKLEGODDESS_219 [Streptomyces phage SparkleGoddess]|uniref:Uncharacterized protein n=1 Tax=Streptomyces phage SparkleGoddess TaxID=2283305 RepID=A0A345MEB7_9CAUD|nr:hypothetical protein SEA_SPARKLEGODDESS_219 [Streptomyces phage SparkleGoddess]UTN92442.1 hypothetical protein SEA_STIGMA_218 [Streptomyces phage Stigma]
MNEFGWSVFGSAAIGGISTAIANGAFDQHWNFFVAWALLFMLYWVIRFGLEIDW